MILTISLHSIMSSEHRTSYHLHRMMSTCYICYKNPATSGIKSPLSNRKQHFVRSILDNVLSFIQV
jgi:hypothetical protein